jgi:hypothetical protein
MSRKYRYAVLVRHSSESVEWKYTLYNVKHSAIECLHLSIVQMHLNEDAVIAFVDLHTNDPLAFYVLNKEDVKEEETLYVTTTSVIPEGADSSSGGELEVPAG